MSYKRKDLQKWPSLAEVEGRYVREVLTHTGGNKQAAARILDVDRKTLDRMIKRHDISISDIEKLKHLSEKARTNQPSLKTKRPSVSRGG